MRATIHFDGGIREHPDGGYVCCHGWVITRDSKVLDRGCGFSLLPDNPGSCTAEFEAMHAALSAGLEKGLSGDQVRIVGDNQSVIGMCAGRSTPSSISAVAGIHKVWSLSKQYTHMSFSWVPRTRNAETDSLCYQAYRSALSGSGRGKLMSDIHYRARRMFGKLYGAKLMSGWIESVIGRGSLLRASTAELETLLGRICTIPDFIARWLRQAQQERGI